MQSIDFFPNGVDSRDCTTASTDTYFGRDLKSQPADKDAWSVPSGMCAACQGCSHLTEQNCQWRQFG